MKSEAFVKQRFHQGKMGFFLKIKLTLAFKD
jgi:hypothetical protein